MAGDTAEGDSEAKGTRSRNVSNASGSSANQRPTSEPKLPDGSKGFQSGACGRGKWFETETGKAIKLGMQRMKIRSIGSNPQGAKFEQISSKLLNNVKSDEAPSDSAPPSKIEALFEGSSQSNLSCEEQAMVPSVAQFFSQFTSNTAVAPETSALSSINPTGQRIPEPEPAPAPIPIMEGIFSAIPTVMSASQQALEETPFQQLMSALQVSSSGVRPMPVAAINEEELHNDAKQKMVQHGTSVQDEEKALLQMHSYQPLSANGKNQDTESDRGAAIAESISTVVKEMQNLHRLLASQLRFMEGHIARPPLNPNFHSGLQKLACDLKASHSALSKTFSHVKSTAQTSRSAVNSNIKGSKELGNYNLNTFVPKTVETEIRDSSSFKAQSLKSNCRSDSQSQDLEEEIIIAKPIN